MSRAFPDPLVSAGIAAARAVFEGKPQAPHIARFCVLRHPDGTHSAAEIEELHWPCADTLIAPVYERADAETMAAALNAYVPPAERVFDEIGDYLRKEVARHG